MHFLDRFCDARGVPDLGNACSFEGINQRRFPDVWETNNAYSDRSLQSTNTAGIVLQQLQQCVRTKALRTTHSSVGGGGREGLATEVGSLSLSATLEGNSRQLLTKMLQPFLYNLTRYQICVYFTFET